MDICGARRGVGGHQPVNPEEARLRAAGGRGCLPEQRSSLLRTLCFIYIFDARRSSQSVLKEISPECSLEGLMLKLKLRPPDAKNQLTGKNPDAGKD